jgi:hypothetical protein
VKHMTPRTTPWRATRICAELVRTMAALVLRQQQGWLLFAPN